MRQRRNTGATLVSSPHGPAELLVGHLCVAALAAPQLCHLLAADEAEHPLVVVLPADEARAVLRVLEQVADELPEATMTFFCTKK